MMAWQRGPPKQQGPGDENRKRVLRSRAFKPDALQEFQKLNHATSQSSKRLSPSFVNETIDALGCFTNNAEIQKSRSKDLAWVVSRMYDDDKSVPEWRALNEATSIFDPPVTTPAMFPILQAPADNSDTLTIVINQTHHYHS